LGVRVLIAEDEANIVESLTFILGREGFDVSTVTDGEAALRSLRHDAPDLLILDVMMPRLNGFEVLKKIRADALLQRLPVIVLTAKTQARDRETAIAVGADAYMTKPYSNREVVEQVRRLTGG
jgi:DNA-binding response OmpR family regulator